MSYILDALRKSEQQRQNDAAPAVQSLQRPAVTRSTRRRSLWLPLIVAILLGNAVLLAGFWWMQQPAAVPPLVDTDTDTRAARQAGVASAPGDSTYTPAPAAETPALETGTDASPPAPADTRPPIPASPPRERPVLELWEIPDDVRARMPALTYSFHVYSSDPARRTIIINGKRVTEGSDIAANLRLEQITEKGVVLVFEDHRVRVQVLEGW
ncbi:MAG TPA: general secretion pathway protein GspB [Spongiibacteraceae bacterium]|nr:general secretion pathway protein GspB [Spongiibacteraceae bacterium]